MASYSLEDLDTAVEQVKEGKLSYCMDAAEYGIPHSTIHDHIVNKMSSSKRTSHCANPSRRADAGWLGPPYGWYGWTRE